MRDGKQPQSASLKWAVANDPLLTEARPRLQTTFVEHLGREAADLRMEPPRLFEEKAVFIVDSLRAAEQMVERRNIGALGMATLRRLLELSRIAKEHDTGACVRNRQHVCKRHLRGLVDEDDVDD